MKRIIDGKRYDTETAKCLGEYSHGFPGDFRRIEQALYRTKSGAYFVAGTGGPLTEYATDLGNNSRGGGAGLNVLTAQEAQAWAERKLTSEEVEEAFGSTIHDA